MPVLPLMTTRELPSSSSTPGASTSGPQMPLPISSATPAPNFAQQPLIVPGYPLYNGVPPSSMPKPGVGPLAEDPPMMPLSALVNPTPSSSSVLTLEPRLNETGDPVQRAIAHAVAQIANSNQTSELRQAAEERRQRFLNDERVGDVEPHRVLCKLCQKWYKLSNDIEYASYNWYKHIKRCEGKAGE